MKKCLWLLLAVAVSCTAIEKDENINLNDKKTEVVSLQSNETENNMQEFLNSTIGTSAVLILVYVAGGVTFTPVWNWVKAKIPFINK